MSLFRKQRRAIGRQIVQVGRLIRQMLPGRKALPGIQNLPTRILIIRPFFLGDILLCLPIAQAIKRQRPDTQISWLLRQEWTDLIRDPSPVDEVIPFSQKKMHSIRSVGEFMRVTRELRKRSFEIVINLSWDRSSILWAWASGAPFRIGIEEYGRPRLLSLLHTITVLAPERSRDQRHMADFYYEPLRLLGFGSRTEIPEISSTSEEEQRVMMRLKPAWDETQRFLLVHPGGRLICKRWPVERFAELIHRLQKETTHPIVLVCGPGEELWAANLAVALASERILFWPVPSLGELMALAERAALFIGNDSGPMHLSAACGCRVVAIVGTNSTRWVPLGNGHQIIRGTTGLDVVTVRQVSDAVLKVLGKYW